jgi:hypothetical protein
MRWNCWKLIINDSSCLKVVREGLTSMFRLSCLDFHGCMIIYENLWVRVWWKIYIDQEHESLLGVCVSEVVFELLSKMDVW